MLNCLLVASSKTTGGFEYFVTLPNNGLASIAGNINKEYCNVEILDLVKVRYKAKSHFTNYIKQNHFDIIGFSCMVFQFNEILELARLVKLIDKNIITVIGGYYATVCHDELLESDNMQYFNFIIRGEGEITFRKLIDGLHNGQNGENVPGLSFIKDGKACINPRIELADLSLLNLPDRNARIFRKGFSFLNFPADVSETSRGCTYTCNFCSITRMYGTTYRRFPINRIIEDIKNIRNNGVKVILFSDDNITLDIKHFEELCNAIISNGLTDIKYIIQASVKGFHDNPHLPALVSKAGFKWIFLGIESYSDDALKFFHKDNQLKSSDVQNVVRALKNEKIFVFGAIILGNPFDTRDTIQRAYQFVKEIKIDMPIFLSLTPFPGTELRDNLLKNNYITNLNDYSRYDNYQVNVRTDSLSSFELFEAIDSIIQKYYVDSGAIFKVLSKYPLFFIKSFFYFLWRHPDMVFHHLTKGRFLKKARERKYA